MYVVCVVCVPSCRVWRTTICGRVISFLAILYYPTAYVCTFVCVHVCNHTCVHFDVYICAYTKFFYMMRNNMWTRHVFFCTVLYCIVDRRICTFVCAPTSFPLWSASIFVHATLFLKHFFSDIDGCIRICGRPKFLYLTRNTVRAVSLVWGGYG